MTNGDVICLRQGDTGREHHRDFILSNSAFLCELLDVLHIISMTNLAVRKPMQSDGTTSGDLPTLPTQQVHDVGAAMNSLLLRHENKKHLQAKNFQNMPNCQSADILHQGHFMSKAQRKEWQILMSTLSPGSSKTS